MANKIKYGSMVVEGADANLLRELMRAAEPVLMDAIEKQLQQLKEGAQKGWPKRQTRTRRDGSIREGTVSQSSADAFVTTLKAQQGGKLAGSVENTAQYAWAIRAGSRTPSITAGGSAVPVRKGGRVADVLLWQPAKKGAAKLTKIIADQTMKRLKRHG